MDKVKIFASYNFAFQYFFLCKIKIIWNTICELF